MVRYFISYSWQDDVDKIEKIIAHLNDAEIEHWWDNQKRPAGRDWDNEIQDALDFCDVMLLFVSPSFMNDEIAKKPWVYFSQKYDKPIFFVILKEIQVSFISEEQRVDYFLNNDFDTAVQQLGQMLKPDTNTPEQTTIKPTYKSWLIWLRRTLGQSPLRFAIAILMFISFLVGFRVLSNESVPTVRFTTIQRANGAHLRTEPNADAPFFAIVAQDGVLTAYATTGEIEGGTWFLVQNPTNISQYGWVVDWQVYTDIPINLLHFSEIDNFRRRFPIPNNP